MFFFLGIFINSLQRYKKSNMICFFCGVLEPNFYIWKVFIDIIST